VTPRFREFHFTLKSAAAGAPKSKTIALDFNPSQKISEHFKRKICRFRKASYFCNPSNKGMQFLRKFFIGIKKPL
jgi:hypothetical protein